MRPTARPSCDREPFQAEAIRDAPNVLGDIRDATAGPAGRLDRTRPGRRSASAHRRGRRCPRRASATGGCPACRGSTRPARHRGRPTRRRPGFVRRASLSGARCARPSVPSTGSGRNGRGGSARGQRYPATEGSVRSDGDPVRAYDRALQHPLRQPDPRADHLVPARIRPDRARRTAIGDAPGQPDDGLSERRRTAADVRTDVWTPRRNGSGTSSPLASSAIGHGRRGLFDSWSRT